ncbi:MAG TPA: hypothetical protein VJ044_16025, partial [Candidatus Hodarchaeales archaeon]|nr:hypothetical protein [Candidatus Hodarchaeales archaeon]
YGGPIIGAIHDYITAAYLLTWKKTFFTRQEAWQLLLSGNYEEDLPPPAIELPKELWTGKQLFSLLLPEDVNTTAKTRTARGDPNSSTEFDSDDAVVIRDGELLTGTIDRKAIGADESESVLHVVVKDHGSDRARIFIDSLTQMLLKYFSHLGFSLGLNDINVTENVRQNIRQTLEKAEKDVENTIESYRQGQLQPLPGKSLKETLEMKIMGFLSKARDRSGEISRSSLGRDNTVVIMATTGARGTPLSITQMSAAVGQQSIRGERILRGYRDRSLPHFKKGDDSAPARGFVRSNYREGLNPLEFFFHAQGGREGLVDTAVRTSTSGYLQRRLVNALQDLQVNYDQTVRTTDGEIVQLRYGEDGVDPMKSYHGRPIDISSIIQEAIAFGESTESVEILPNKLLLDRIFSYSDEELPDKVKNELYFEVKKLKDMSVNDLDRICEASFDAYQRALAEPGEAIGTVASQSIGEPGTQMTLKTFHFAGV